MSAPGTTATMTPYDEAFYDEIQAGSSRSAAVILPLVFEWIRPASVVDVGCGVGTWLGVAEQLGAHDVLGLDGDYVDRSRLAIQPQRFRAADLSRPFAVGRSFDLAMSLEVAEHLGSESAAGFVELLASLAPAVLFSAAAPRQGGKDHRNEQWPTYWAELFANHGLDCYDPLRPLLWSDARVEVWYRQNVLLFLRPSHPAAAHPCVRHHRTLRPMDAMHPDLYLVAQERWEQRALSAERPGIGRASRTLASALLRGLRGERLIASRGGSRRPALTVAENELRVVLGVLAQRTLQSPSSR